jgi:ribosomal protein S18 acetylase RimI-like enzyme
MEIRTAVRPDLTAIAACEASAFGSPPPSVAGDTTKSHARLLAQILQGEIRVVEDEIGVLGFISFSTNYEHLFVSTIAVLPQHQRQGLGTRLLATAELEAAQRGLAHVSLFTDGPASHNLAFYRSRGFRETGRCEGPDFARIYLSKPIARDAAAAA